MTDQPTERVASELVELKPVAWMYQHPSNIDDFGTTPLTAGDKAEGWTETPLYTAAQLQSELAAQQAAIAGLVIFYRAKNGANFDRTGAAWEAYDKATLDCHAAIRAAKDPSNG